MRTLPAISLLRFEYTKAQLTWLVEPKSAGAIEGAPGVDEVLIFPRDEINARLRAGRSLAAIRLVARTVRAMRRRRFDLVVDFHAILKSGLLSLASGAPLRASYAPEHSRELSWLFANRRARLQPVSMSRFERNEALVRFLGIEGKPVAYRLPVDPTLRAEFDLQLGPGRTRVVIHPGSSEKTPYKRYTLEGYAKVARQLSEDDGVQCIVSAGPGGNEKAFADSLVAAAKGAVLHAPATPTLSHLGALFATCRLFLGSDSGPLHLASLVGVPVVQILGPTHPIENAPYPASDSRSVRVPVLCSPCRRGCAAATCMRLVPPAEIVRSARELLAASAE